MARARKNPSQNSVIDRVTLAVDALRRGKPVVIGGEGGAVIARAVETLAKVPPKSRLVLSHARARTLKMRLYTPEIVALDVERSATLETLRAIADPTDDLRYPLKGPFDTVRAALPKAY